MIKYLYEYIYIRSLFSLQILFNKLASSLYLTARFLRWSPLSRENILLHFLHSEALHKWYLWHYRHLRFRQHFNCTKMTTLYLPRVHLNMAGHRGRRNQGPTLLRTQSYQRFSFQVWSRLEYNFTCFACCWGFPPFQFLPSQFIQLHFPPDPLQP